MEPGDMAAGIRFAEAAQDGGGFTLPEVPVALRTLIPIGPTGGSFTGNLTGGNGRPGAGPTQTFEFDVPEGVKDMSLAFQTADNGYLLEGLLIDPNGMQLSVQPNLDPFGDPQFGMQLFRGNPQAGRWKFILVQDFTSSGNQTSLPFTAKVAFNTARIFTSNVPNSPSTVISASASPVTFTIDVVNTGAVTEAYFADARMSTLGVSSLALQGTCANSLPGTCGLFYVPTQVKNILFIANSTVPIQMDAYNSVGYNVGSTGSPDLLARNFGQDTVVASLSEPEIPYGAWYEIPALIGPYGAAGAPTEPVTMSAFALMHPFDPALAPDSGDVWADLTLGTKTFNPLVLASGEGGAITVTVKPDPSQVGKTIEGYVYVDTFNPIVGTGDEVFRFHYAYTVAP
jgi:hypothetical protein